MRTNKKMAITFSLLVVLLPFLYQYKGIGVISLGELLLTPFMLVYIIKLLSSGKAKIDKFLLLFYISCVALSFFSSFSAYFSLNDFLTIFARLVFYGILIFVSRYFFNYSHVRKYYWAFVSAVCFYTLLQFVTNSYFGIKLPNTINSDWIFSSEVRTNYMDDYWYRPSGLFMEPSYLALFSLPCLADCLITKKYKSWLLCTVLIIGAFLVSRSSAGFIGLILIVVMSIFVYQKNKSIGKQLLWIISILFFGVFVWLSGVAELSIARLQEGGSFESRILNGFYLFAKLDFKKQLFGVGINNLSNYIEYYGITSGLKTYGLDSYSSSISGLLNSCGIIGFLIFALYAIRLLKIAKTPISKCMYVLFIYVFCIEAVLFSYRFGFYVILLSSFAFLDCDSGVGLKHKKNESFDYFRPVFSDR